MGIKRIIKCGNITIIVTLLLVSASLIKGQSDYTVFPWKQTFAVNSYLLRTVHEQYEMRRDEIKKTLTSKQDLIQYQNECKQKYWKLFGEVPFKTKLNPQIVGTINQKGYRIEKIIYESVPNRHVTVNFYVPDGIGPFPVIVYLCGHWQEAKVTQEIVEEALLLVKNGFAAFVIDPIGQGERDQLVDEKGNPLTRGATTEHTLLNAGANLVGTSILAQEIWDNIRGIDYLETRQDIDKQKIGCIGSSGGGMQTTYTVVADPRIKTAVVCSFVTTWERKLENMGAPDGCQYFPYEGREHLEIADYLTMFAPKPLLIMSGCFDFVDYWGALTTYKELKKVYSTLNQPEKVGMFSIPYGHGMPQPKREASVTWFRKWLLGDNTPIHENNEGNVFVPDKDLLCTSIGNVVTNYKNEQTVSDYFSDLSQKYSLQRKEFVDTASDKTFKTKMLDLLGISIPMDEVTIELTGKISSRAYDIYKYEVLRKDQIPVPCLVYLPEYINLSCNVIIYLNEEGKNNIALNKDEINPFINNGDILILADLRGFGETVDALEKNSAKYWDKEYRNAMISLHIGKPLMGQRVIDIISLLDFINTQPEMKNHKIKIFANGIYCPAVIHAAFLDNRINEADLSRSIKSFKEFIRNPLQRDMFSNVLFGVLKYYDLPDLVKKIGSNKAHYND